MDSVSRSTTMQASVQTVWDYLADPAHWSQWDPDITDVGTTEIGIVDGRTWPLRVKPGLAGTLSFGAVEHHRSFTWDIRALAGLIRSDAEFRLEPADDPELIVFHYRFELAGPIGRLLGRLQAGPVIEAVETGLANIAAAIEQR